MYHNKHIQSVKKQIYFTILQQVSIYFSWVSFPRNHWKYRAFTILWEPLIFISATLVLRNFAAKKAPIKK